MFRRMFVIILAVMLFLPPVSAQEPTGSLLIRPGKTERIAFDAASAGNAVITLQDAGGAEVFTIYDVFPASVGTNYFVWNGYAADGQPVAQGTYQLSIQTEQSTILKDVTVGTVGPSIDSFNISSATVIPGEEWRVTAFLNLPGELTASLNINGVMQVVAHKGAQTGENTLVWDGYYNGNTLSPGTHMLALELRDDTGFLSNPHYIGINLAAVATPEPTPVATPVPTPKPVSYKPPTAEQVAPEQLGSNYWTLPAGKWDEAAIWNVMTQPITVVKGLSKRAQTEMYRLRAAPDTSMKDENILGEITCESQGVNILQTLDNGWSYVEIFNSSYGPDCDARPGWGNSDELIRGYVETDRLTSITPRTDYGILIDKLTQVMYVFQEGKLMTELAISTGKPTKQQPWNETPSGEFLMVSRTGGFYAGNLYCDMAMRINGGCLIHEVPYIMNEATNYKDYSSEEWKLGTKASHGCIRVQRKKNDEGANMSWLWNNIKVNTKVLVWDDMPGRYHDYPADDLMLYYNPTGGKYFHSDQNCSSIKSRYLPLEGSFPYAQLDDAQHQSFTPCQYCNPPMRKVEIDELNRQNGF